MEKPKLGPWRRGLDHEPGQGVEWRDPAEEQGPGALVQRVRDVTGGDGYWLWEAWGPRPPGGAGGYTSGHVASPEVARVAADSAAEALGWGT